jgi:Ca2+-binding EF-hand superfamily protein
MRNEVQSQMNGMFENMFGLDPSSILSEDEVRKHMRDAFEKFDKDSSGLLGQWEFNQAWFSLGLKGSEAELKDAFDSVDTNKSGEVDLEEFIQAVKSERMAEFSLQKVLDTMGVKYATAEQRYEAFKKATARRRLMKKQMEENIRTTTKDIISKLANVSEKPIPQRDIQGEKQYKTLRDTFDAFDKDGSAELGYNEFVESWRFLNRPGTEAEIKQAFDGVDVDKSGLVEFSEYAFALMGEKALQFSPLADLELLNTLLDDTAGLLASLSADLKDAAAQQAERAKDNAALRERMMGMKGEMNGKIGSIMSKMMDIMGADPMDIMTDEEIDRVLGATFEKFDYDKSGVLEKPEFIKAWEFLGLKGSADQVSRAFDKVDVDSSGKIERREFIMAIRDSRLAELSMSVLMEKNGWTLGRT